jgi:molybdopterin converting factor small subunit
LSNLDGSRSSFVSPLYTVDTFLELLDLPISQKTNADRYMILRQKTRTAEEEIEFQSLTTTLQNYIVTPETLNKMNSCIINMENFIKSNVEGYITIKQTEFNALIAQFTDKGTYDPAVTYQTMNFVHYTDGNVYIALQQSLNQTPSSSPTYWRVLSIHGETGYSVDVQPQGDFSASTQYHLNDLVYYNGNLYRCIVDSLGNYPTNETYFSLFLAGNGETLSNLNTNTKVSLVSAINEVLGDVGDKTTLNTTEKDNIVDAINEVLDDTDYPFKIKSAFYTVGTDTLSIVISDGVGETINNNTINTITKTSDTTFNITPIFANTTYTIYLKNDGNFASSTDGSQVDGSILIGTVLTNSDKTVNTIVDKRPLVSGVGKKVSEHLADETQHVPYAVASGSANTYAVTLSPTPTSLVAGMALAVKINVDSTGASTININGLGAKGIKKANGTDVTNLKANGIYTLRYDGTNFTLQGSDAAGNATPADILSGKTATTDAGEITGTIPSKSAQTYTPTTTNQVISAGQYLSGAQTVRGDANLLAANILSGKSIFGVAGNAASKKYASGTCVASSTTITVYGYNDTEPSIIVYPITVSGLTFQPEILMLYRSAYLSYGDQILMLYYNQDYFYQDAQYEANLLITTVNSVNYVKVDGSILYVNPTAFTLASAKIGSSIKWCAWG